MSKAASQGGVPAPPETKTPTAEAPADDSFMGSGFGHTQLNLRSPFPDPELHGRLLAFRELTLALGTELDLRRRIQLAIREIRRIMEAERATVFLYDIDTRSLWTRVHDGARAHDIEIPLGKGVVGRVAERVASLNIKDVTLYPGHDCELDRSLNQESRAVLAVPMTSSDGSLLGVVQVVNKRSAPHFGGTDETLLVSLSQVLAINVEHARLYTQTRQQLVDLQAMRGELEEKVSELELLYESTREAAAALSPEDLATRIGGLVLSRLPFRAVLLVYAAPDAPCARAILVRDSRPSTRRAEIGRPRWLDRSDEDLAAGMDGVGQLLLAGDEAPTAVLQFPASADVVGAMAVYDHGLEGPLPDEQRKVLSVVLAQLVSGFRRAFELESERVEDRLRTIGRTVSNILHDMRTPMAVIQGYAQLLRNELPEADRGRYADGVREQLDRIKRMTEDVLAFARGDRTILTKKVYLRAFMANLEETCRQAFSGRGVDFVFDCQDRGAARFDEHKIERVLLNLCRNAVEAMPNGGTCTVRVERQGEELHFAVEDEGVGIPAYLQKQVFQAFQTHGKKKGTGLGLSMSKRIVEAHGGRISLESEPGQGTIIRLVLPVEVREAA